MKHHKRQATETLLPLRAPKQRRLTRDYMLGETSNPTHFEDISARWMKLAHEFVKLTRDTIAKWGEDTNEKLPVAGPSQPGPSSKPPRPSTPPPPRRPGRAPIPPQFQEARSIQAPPSKYPDGAYRLPPTFSRKGELAEVKAEPQAVAAASTMNAFAESRSRRQMEPHPDRPKVRTLPRRMATRTYPAQGRDPAAQRAHLDSELSKKVEEYRNVEKQKVIGREHILVEQHKRKVKESRLKEMEEMERQWYEQRRQKGFTSDFESFRSLLHYEARLNLQSQREALSPSPSLVDLRSQPSISPDRRRSIPEDYFLRRALEKAKASLEGPKPPKPRVPSFEQILALRRDRDAQIELRLRGPPLPIALPPDDDRAVDDLLAKQGVIAKIAREQVTGGDLIRLKPRQWLNDEIINFYGQLIMSRSESKEKSVANGRKKPLNVHYFSTFFWSKLENAGYDKGRLAKWTKNVDIFHKDVVLIPVNHSNTHWTAAAINFRRKRIESYDSMGYIRKHVFKLLRIYLDAEHRNKKKKPFDFTGWEDFHVQDVPLQENGYDCGVFTCQFLEALSRGEEKFRFRQSNMPYLRRRMVWEIGHGKLRDDS